MTRKESDTSDTAEGILARLEADPAYRKRVREREERSRNQQRMYMKEAATLLDELERRGFPVNAVGELVNGPDYKRVMPLLVQWLDKTEYEPLQDDIVRTLSIPSARPYANELIELFYKATSSNLQWIIGNYLEVVAHDGIADPLLEIAQKRVLGIGRQMVVMGLGRLRKRRADAVQALRTLLFDDEVRLQAIVAAGRLCANELLGELSVLQESQHEPTREHASRALKKINR